MHERHSVSAQAEAVAGTLDAITIGRDEDWTDVDGLLAKYRTGFLRRRRFPNKPLAAMAAYATLSAPCGGRLYSPTGLGLNLYLAMLAPSEVRQQERSADSDWKDLARRWPDSDASNRQGVHDFWL